VSLQDLRADAFDPFTFMTRPWAQWIHVTRDWPAAAGGRRATNGPPVGDYRLRGYICL